MFLLCLWLSWLVIKKARAEQQLREQVQEPPGDVPPAQP
jgi:hypothetical protein